VGVAITVFLLDFFALHESAIDAVDGSSTRHASAMDVGAD
jgi:hypothetical protein